MKTVDLVYFDAGGGHRAAAEALALVMQDQGRPWRVRRVHLVEAIDPRGLFRKTLGFEPEALYNQRLARGWTLGLGRELKVLQAMIRLYHPFLVRRLQEHWARTEPDLVVSLIPNFNRALAESVASACPGVPFLTVMTDLADLPPHFWAEADVRQQLVCGTERAWQQARALGLPASRLERVSGMVLRPMFHDLEAFDRRAALAELGLDPDRPTGVVMFGGHGSRQMLSIARQLRHVQLVFLCGRNPGLVRRLEALALARPGRAAAPHVATGFRRDVVRWLRLGDFFVGKPGPGCLSEALHLGLPVLTFDNAWTMPQERFNAQWVREQGLGVVLRSSRRVAEGVADLLGRLDDCRDRARALDNRAVFEVVDLVARHLAAADAPDLQDLPGVRSSESRP